jgi:hypothetical protein
VGYTEPVPFLLDCAQRVMVGGCVALVLGAAELTVNQVLISGRYTLADCA